MRKCLLLLLLCGCVQPEPTPPSQPKLTVLHHSGYLIVQKITIEGENFLVFQGHDSIFVLENKHQPEKP